MENTEIQLFISKYKQEYNIYDNDEISKENIDKLAQVIFSNELDLEKIFDVRNSMDFP